jgi:phosphohistidine phosphatase
VKVLHLLRHAKSSWEDASLPDHDRPLAARGQRAARKVADHIRRTGIAPAVVLCSTARRATETLDAIMPAFEPAPEVRIEGGLYDASTDALVHRLREVPATVPSVMLIGHNPSIQLTALVLVGGDDDARLAALRQKMPTGALATLELEGTWSAIAAGSARLRSFVVPRDLS